MEADWIMTHEHGRAIKKGDTIYYENEQGEVVMYQNRFGLFVDITKQ